MTNQALSNALVANSNVIRNGAVNGRSNGSGVTEGTVGTNSAAAANLAAHLSASASLSASKFYVNNLWHLWFLFLHLFYVDS